MQLTEAQKELAYESGSRFVKACPGAGKTRAIAIRFEHRARNELRKGIALLSFTNAAVDEVMIRCATDGSLFESPHFIGTVDAFINRFVVAPLYVGRYGKYPRFVESWDSIPSARVSIPEMTRGLSYSLEWFEPIDGGLALLEECVTGKYSNALISQHKQHSRRICQRAKFLSDKLIERGVLSSAASRRLCQDALGNPAERGLIGDLLHARFTEVIVDEAQDCGREELQLLRLLREQGVDVVAVADLDQAIFEWRRALPAEVDKFASELPFGTRLDGNFRSTPSICAAIACLRVGDECDEAVGYCCQEETPVHLVCFDDLDAVRGMAKEIVEDAGLSTFETRVLAHKRVDARRVCGASMDTVVSQKKALRLLSAGKALRSVDTDSRARREAVRTAERVLVELIDIDNADDHATEELVANLGIDDRWLRSAAVRVAVGVDPANMTREQYASKLRSTIEKTNWPAGVSLKDLSAQLRAPTNAEWLASSSQPDAHVGQIQGGTVHSAKGHEYTAVVLILPERLLPDAEGRNVLELWEQDLEGEARRVLYVGASRAERLLIFAVHKSHFQRVKTLLENDRVPLACH